MPTLPDLEAITDDQLLASVRKLVARTNTALADLLAHLGEVEARGIHRLRACASLYTYCIYELRMSEDEAYRRSKAARQRVSPRDAGRHSRGGVRASRPVPYDARAGARDPTHLL